METINRIKEYCLNVYKKSDIQEYTLDDNFNLNDEFICIICLDNFNKGETITRIKCNHYEQISEIFWNSGKIPWKFHQQ